MTGRVDDHTMWHELVAGYALHALDAEDEARVVEHLRGCDECRAELDVQALTASHLASLADDPTAKPPAWSQIRRAIVEADGASDVADLAARRARRGAGSRWLLAAAAAAVVLTGATVASVEVLRTNGGSSTSVALSHCVASRGCLAIDLRSSDGTRRASVFVTDGSVRVQPLAMSAPAAGRTFVLWQLPQGGAPIALGEFASTELPSQPDLLAVPLAQTTAFAVSSEPAGTPPKKPSQVLALGGVTT